MIRPPFPFPDQWDRVSAIQKKNNEKFWCVPLSSETENNVFAVNPSGDFVGAEEEDTEEVLEMNEEWANHFSNTIERMNQKRKRDNLVNSLNSTANATNREKNRNRRKKNKIKKLETQMNTLTNVTEDTQDNNESD
jgi:hypothetical protein